MDVYDALVVGAGPGGATTATFMARDGLRVLVVDKDAFPRDKVCGDAISGKSVDVLRRLGLVERVQQAKTIGSWGITFSGPYGDQVTIPFTKELGKPVPPGFVCAREDFDVIVYEAAVEAGAEVWTNAAVTGLVREGARVVGAHVKRDGVTQEVRARLVIGADGAYSAVVRGLGLDQLDEKHYCAGLRAYYHGVTGFDTVHNAIELHFVNEAIPGYFWIFPMADGRANVGIGILSSEVKKRGIKLKAVLDACIANPRFAPRFADASRDGKVLGWGLPLGSKPRPLQGDGWMLVGDAGSLIDPFSGEGIGNAMISGEIAARWAARAKETGDVSAAALEGYGREVMAYLGDELRLSHAMQRLGNWKWLLNTVIRKASRSPHVAAAISSMFDDEASRKQLLSPLFYLRVLTA